MTLDATMAARVCSVVLLLCACVAAQSMNRVVQTDQGPVRGYKSEKGDFYTFFGIPYATAPTGRDKFKAPLPPRTWTEILEANNDLIFCPQLFAPVMEDCLVVNVFVPTSVQTQTQEPLPVMFYIHGGAFTQGYGAMVSPELLLEHEGLIVVHINYRLGAAGFLCMLDKDIPGNAGYKDQVAGLRWVKRNIASFGGNPNDITIAGFSAGSISVDFFMLSPMADGLFHKAISESGSVLCPFSEVRDPIGFAKSYASALAGRNVDNITEVKNYLLDATAEQLLSASLILSGTADLSSGFGVCIESPVEGTESFLTETPISILHKGNYNKNIPYVTGITSDEGTLLLGAFDVSKIIMEDHFAEFLPAGLKFPSESEKNEVAERVKQFYFNNQTISDATIRGYVDFITDISFAYPQIRTARLHAQNSVPVYFYLYSYIVSEYPPHPHDDKIRGAVHYAQSFCVNRIIWLHNPVNESDNDVLMHNRLTKMWYDFAKYGMPVVHTSPLLPVMWNRMNLDRMNYLDMNVNLAARDNILSDRVQLWDEIYEKYYNSSPTISSLCVIIFSIIFTIFVNM